MEKRYKEIDGVRYQVIQNTILGSNVVPVGESLPEVTTSDNGKLLGVSSGEWTPVDAPSGLPDITGNAGKVLKVNAGATGTEWANETTELPAVTAADEGDVLTVNASGEWEAAAPASGGLTLYGPYTATVSSTQTIPGNTAMDIMLDSITDENEDAKDLYSAPNGTLFIVSGITASSINAEYRGFHAPVYNPLIPVTMPPSISFDNKDASPASVSDYVKITFFSSYELPAFSPTPGN